MKEMRNNAIKDLHNDLEKMRKECNNLRKENDILRNSNKRMGSELERVRKDNYILKEFKTETRRLEKALEDLFKISKDLKRENERYKQEIYTATEKVEFLKSKLKEMDYIMYSTNIQGNHGTAYSNNGMFLNHQIETSMGFMTNFYQQGNTPQYYMPQENSQNYYIPYSCSDQQYYYNTQQPNAIW